MIRHKTCPKAGANDPGLVTHVSKRKGNRFFASDRFTGSSLDGPNAILMSWPTAVGGGARGFSSYGSRGTDCEITAALVRTWSRRFFLLSFSRNRPLNSRPFGFSSFGSQRLARGRTDFLRVWNRFDPSGFSHRHSEPNRTSLERTEPNRKEPNRTEPNRTPNRFGTVKIPENIALTRLGLLRSCVRSKIRATNTKPNSTLTPLEPQSRLGTKLLEI